MMSNNKPKQNYFDQNIRQYGEDFLLQTSPERIQRAAKQRIFREMVRGEIDYVVYAKYFTDPKFFENLFIAAGDELQNNTTLANALDVYDKIYPGNAVTILLKAKYQNLSYIFGVIYNKLFDMKQNVYNIGCISDLSAILYQYRNQL